MTIDKWGWYIVGWKGKRMPPGADWQVGVIVSRDKVGTHKGRIRFCLGRTYVSVSVFRPRGGWKSRSRNEEEVDD